MSCMKLRAYEENKKVIEALKPSLPCPTKAHLCPCINPLRSSIYHPDFRTENQYCCSQHPYYLPTLKALEAIRYEPANAYLYNQPKLPPEQRNGYKVIFDRSVPESCHMNGRCDEPCCGEPETESYVCNDPNCYCQIQLEAISCCPTEQQPPITIDAGVGCTSEEKCEDSCNDNSSSFGRNHFEDCLCSLCKKRREENKPMPEPSRSSPVWFQCDSQDCSHCNSNSNCTSNTISNSDCIDIDRETESQCFNSAPYHHIFNIENEASSSSNCQQNLQTSCCQVEPVWNGNGIAVNQNCPKATTSNCNCFQCFSENKNALHGAYCPCELCTRLRCSSRKRPNYYSTLRRKSCNASNAINGWNKSRTTNCFQPIRNRNCQMSNYLCDISVPTQWKQQIGDNSRTCCKNLTSSKCRQPLRQSNCAVAVAGRGLCGRTSQRPPCLVRPIVEKQRHCEPENCCPYDFDYD